MEQKLTKAEKSSYLAPGHGSPKKREILAAGTPEPINKLFSIFMSMGGSIPVRLWVINLEFLDMIVPTLL